MGIVGGGLQRPGLPLSLSLLSWRRGLYSHNKGKGGQHWGSQSYTGYLPVLLLTSQPSCTM